MFTRVYGSRAHKRLQWHRIVYMGFVHCGGTFQMPTQYGTRIHDTYILCAAFIMVSTASHIPSVSWNLIDIMIACKWKSYYWSETIKHKQ